MYGGDFSNWVDSSGKQIPIYDPTTQTVSATGVVTRTPFPGNKIPQNLFSPTALKAISVFQTSGVLKGNNGAAAGHSWLCEQQLPCKQWNASGAH